MNKRTEGTTGLTDRARMEMDWGNFTGVMERESTDGAQDAAVRQALGANKKLDGTQRNGCTTADSWRGHACVASEQDSCSTKRAGKRVRI